MSRTGSRCRIRCADSAEALENPPWQGDISNGDCLCDLNLKGYIQYKLALAAKCGCGTPSITSVTINFEYNETGRRRLTPTSPSLYSIVFHK